MADPYNSPFTGAQVDSAVDGVINGSYMARKDTLAAARAMTKAEMAKSGAVFIKGQDAAYDGLLSGLYLYEAFLSEEDDGINFIRPVNFNGAGMIRKLI